MALGLLGFWVSGSRRGGLALGLLGVRVLGFRVWGLLGFVGFRGGGVWERFGARRSSSSLSG